MKRPGVLYISTWKYQVIESEACVFVLPPPREGQRSHMFTLFLCVVSGGVLLHCTPVTHFNIAWVPF